jgi:hypothetical protein
MSKGPYTVWVDYGCEGWKPKECATWDEAFDMVMGGSLGGPCRITREAWFVPVAEPPAPVPEKEP